MGRKHEQDKEIHQGRANPIRVLDLREGRKQGNLPAALTGMRMSAAKMRLQLRRRRPGRAIRENQAKREIEQKINP
jgi:hypothetical protein